jgi:hypothetical protein
MSEDDIQYLIHVQKKDEQSYLVGPFKDHSETVSWLYNQLGCLKVAFPTTELEKIKWNYVIDTSGFMEKHLVDIEVKFGDFHLKVLDMLAPQIVRIHPECKESRDRVKSGEIPDIVL